MKCKHCGKELEGYITPEKAISDRYPYTGTFVLMHIRDKDDDVCFGAVCVGFYQRYSDGTGDWFWEAADYNDLIVKDDLIAVEGDEIFNDAIKSKNKGLGIYRGFEAVSEYVEIVCIKPGSRW